MASSALQMFYDHPLLIAAAGTSTPVEESVALSLPYGTVQVRQWALEGVSIRHTVHRYNDYHLFEKHNHADVVGLEFNLKGRHVIRQGEAVYRVQSRQHSIVYTPGAHNTFGNGDLHTETFAVRFAPEHFFRIVADGNDTLQRFAEAVHRNGAPAVIAPHSLPLTPDLARVIDDMLHCRYTGGLQKLFLYSRSLELLVLQAEAFHRAAHRSTADRCGSDRERIVHARDYLVAHVDNPPGLAELARIAGISEYRLKRGFREVFHTTAFGYLAEYRLEQARRALLDGRKTITDIAFELGYSSPQHFSSAFRRKFGVPPRALRS